MALWWIGALIMKHCLDCLMNHHLKIFQTLIYIIISPFLFLLLLQTPCFPMLINMSVFKWHNIWNIVETWTIFDKTWKSLKTSCFFLLSFFFPKQSSFPLARWIAYTNEAMYTVSINRYSTTYRSVSYIFDYRCVTPS